MVSEIDERRGLVKVQWADIRDRVAVVEPNFARMVDELAPNINFPLYLAYLPYGALKGDTESTFIPTQDNSYIRLTDPNIPKDIQNHLGYGKASSPLGMVLEKELEYFIDLKNERISIPWAIHTPGSFFSFGRNLSSDQSRIYAPNGVLTATSGARSVFMLPNIGCATNHVNLERDFNIQHTPPKSLYEHWHIFKDIINSNIISCDWKSCLIYFSESWVRKIHEDEAWLKLRMYLHEKAWRHYEHQRCRIYYDIAFSIMQKNRNLKPNPYLTDTARHLFSIALGDAPGYIPADNNHGLPTEIIQQAYVESYGLKKYIPTIMKPTRFLYETEQLPIYYSLQNPSTFMFSPKSRTSSSTVFEMRELQHIMNIFMNELSRENAMCADTVMNLAAKDIKFNYYHNKIDRHRIIQSTDMIPSIDKRFEAINQNLRVTGSSFASDSPFVRGCISIST